MLSEALRAQLAGPLRDFSGAARSDFGGASFTRVQVEDRDVPVPELYRFLLVEAVGAVVLPPGDKTAFSVGFRYRDSLCSLALQKFGVRLYVVDSVLESDVGTLASDLIRKLTSAVVLVEKHLLRPEADAQLLAGNVTIANQYAFLRSTYEHFRTEAEATFTAPKPKPKPELGERISASWRRGRVGSYNALAAVNAYFSLLEHTLVLVLPFVAFDPSGGKLMEFIRARWGTKVSGVFDLGSDPVAHRHYNALHSIAETYRNTYAHGGFDKQGAAIWVHLPTIGTLPARLSDIREAPHFELFPVGEADLAEITSAFDAVDAWLRGATTKYGLLWAEEGLNVAYDVDSRARYAAAMASDEDFASFLRDTSLYSDAVDNFDI